MPPARGPLRGRNFRSWGRERRGHVERGEGECRAGDRGAPGAGGRERHLAEGERRGHAAEETRGYAGCWDRARSEAAGVVARRLEVGARQRHCRAATGGPGRGRGAEQGARGS